MLRDAWFLARSDFRLMLREREIVLWAFIMPVVFFFFIGEITGGSSKPDDQRDPLGIIIPPDAGLLADQFVKRLEAAQYQVDRVADGKALSEYGRQVRVPAKMTDLVLAGTPVKINLDKSAGGLGAEFDQFRIKRAGYSLLADLILLTRDGGPVTQERFEELAKRPRNLKVTSAMAGQRREPPRGYQQSVPGTMVFLVLLVLATTGAVLVTEREQGLLRRLASSPMSRGAVVAGKWGARVLLSLVQVAFAIVVGAVFFHIQWGPHYLALAGILLAYIALAASLGMLLGTVCRTQGQVIAAGVTASNVLAALGGCWWPAEITPDWCQKLSMCLPTGWVMDALHKLLNFGVSPMAVLPHFVVLVIAALLCGWLVTRRFRFI